MKRKLHILSACTAGLFALEAQAQSIGPSAISSAGNSAVVAGKTFEYIVGEPLLASIGSLSNYVIISGVLQPQFESGTGIDHPALSTDLLSLFPNPTSNNLFLQPNFLQGGVLQCVLTDVLGRRLLVKEFILKTGRERQQLDMHAIVAGQYNLTCNWSQGKAVAQATFKIQKLN